MAPPTKYIKNHPDGFVTHYILDDLKTDIKLAQVMEFEEILTANIKSSGKTD